MSTDFNETNDFLDDSLFLFPSHFSSSPLCLTESCSLRGGSIIYVSNLFLNFAKLEHEELLFDISA